MRVAPYIFYPGFDNAQLLLHECSDRLLLPQCYCDEANLKVDDILMLTNIYNQSLCGTVYGAHTQDPTVIFAPSWMIYNLDCLDSITIAHCAKTPPKGLCLRTHSEKFANHPDFFKLLNASINNYKSLTKNTRISLLVNGCIEYLTVEAIIPLSLKTCFVHNCGKIDIKVGKNTEPERKSSPYLFKSPHKPTYKFAFIGTGNLLGGTTDPSKPPIAAAANAARKRFELIAAGKKSY